MGIHPRINGVYWLADICPFGEVTYATAWQGGLDTFSCATPTAGAFPQLRRGSTFSLMDGPLGIGVGTITEVAPGEIHGEGLHRLAYGVPALNSSNAPTTWVDDAIGVAMARGDLPGWSLPVSIYGAGGLATMSPDTTLSVGALLDAYATSINSAWWVDARGGVRVRGMAATPTWQTAPPDGQLTTASDEYVTRLYATFMSAPGVFTPRSYIDTAAEAVWSPKPERVDLTPLGVLTTTTVDDILAGMLTKGRARPSYANTVEVAADELTTLNGVPANLAADLAGDGVRLHGTFDDTRLAGANPYTDITIGRYEYVDGAATARITPVGYTPRDFKSILTVALEGGAADLSPSSGTAGSVAWTTYVPTYTNITIGNAVVVAKYMQSGQLITGEVKITMGSTTSFGAGNLQVSLPAVPAVSNVSIGAAWCYDASAGAITLVTPLSTAAALTPFVGTGIPAVTNTVPFTWAVNDVLSFSFTYEAA